MGEEHYNDLKDLLHAKLVSVEDPPAGDPRLWVAPTAPPLPPPPPFDPKAKRQKWHWKTEFGDWNKDYHYIAPTPPPSWEGKVVKSPFETDSAATAQHPNLPDLEAPAPEDVGGKTATEGAAAPQRPAHSRRKSAMFEVPRHVCPGKPSNKNLKAGAPKDSARPWMEKTLRHLADGVAWTEAAGEAPETYTDVSCLFITKPCSANRSTAQGKWVAGKLQLQTDEELAEVAARMPDIGVGGLGSCAIVANSDNMMKAQRGEEIDAHDTIFRHNTPLKGYEKHVGSRRSVVYMKTKYEKQGVGGAMDDVELALAELKDITEIGKGMQSQGKKVFLRASAANLFARLRRQMYARQGFTGRKHPSGGFARPMNLLASGLCTRVDLYGFSGGMGGKYFKPAEKVRPAHVMSFEHWTYRYLQSQGKLCVYGD